jgi:hypothetical protein
VKQQISALDAGGVFRADVPDLTWRDGIKLNLQVRLPSPLRALVCVHPDIAPSRKTLAERGRQHTRRVGFCFRPLNELNLSNRSEDNRFDCSRCGDRSRTRRRASCFIEQGRSSLRAWGLKLAKGIWHAKGKGRHRHAKSPSFFTCLDRRSDGASTASYRGRVQKCKLKNKPQSKSRLTLPDLYVGTPLLSLKRILDRRRRLPDAAHAHRRAVGDEQQLVSASFSVGRGTGDISHLLRSEIASLATGTG